MGQAVAGRCLRTVDSLKAQKRERVTPLSKLNLPAVCRKRTALQQTLTEAWLEAPAPSPVQTKKCEEMLLTTHADGAKHAPQNTRLGTALRVVNNGGRA